jgi:hypothetical protein
LFHRLVRFPGQDTNQTQAIPPRRFPCFKEYVTMDVKTQIQAGLLPFATPSG